MTVASIIVRNLRQLFADTPPLDATDLKGVLNVILHSVKFWGKKDRRRGYLRFLEGFMSELGTSIVELSDDDLEDLEFFRPE